MILKTLTLEGLPAYEKQKGLFPIRWKAHYLTEMFLACLPLKTIDGSSKIVIADSAAPKRLFYRAASVLAPFFAAGRPSLAVELTQDIDDDREGE